MKLNSVFDIATEKTRQFIAKHGESKIKAYMQSVHDSHDWNNYDVRISNDIVKYGAIGTRTACEWCEKFDANDDNLTSLCVAVMKKIGLLPFVPENINR